MYHSDKLHTLPSNWGNSHSVVERLGDIVNASVMSVKFKADVRDAV